MEHAGCGLLSHETSAPLYTGCQRGGKPAMCRPARCGSSPDSAEIPAFGAEAAMDSFEINKILGALLFTCLCLLSLNIAAEAVFHPANPRAWLRSCGDRTRRQWPGRQGAGRTDREAARERDRREGRERGQEVRRLHTLRQGRAETASARTSMASSGARRAQRRVRLFGRDQGKGGNWTVEDLDKIPREPKVSRPAPRELRGVPRGSERADVIALLNSKSDSPQPLPKAADAGGAPKAAEAPAGQKK
jgi:cytochrome c